MNFRQVEVFRAVMNSGSMTAAASELGISQPGVSKTIVALEEDCGYPLFLRQAGRISPTPEARRLIEVVERMFVGINEIRRASSEIRDTVAGNLEIAAFPALSSRILPALLSQFLSERDGVRLSLMGMASRRVIEMVSAQKVDIGLSIVPPDDPNVEAKLLARLDRVCVLPLGHPLTRKDRISLHDLRGETFVALDAQDPERMAIEKLFSDLGIGRRERIETRHSDSATAFVANGFGVTIIDPFTPEAFRGLVEVRPLVPAVHMNLWLLWPRHRTPSNLAKEFIPALSDGIRRYIERTKSAMAQQEPSTGR